MSVSPVHVTQIFRLGDGLTIAAYDEGRLARMQRGPLERILYRKELTLLAEILDAASPRLKDGAECVEELFDVNALDFVRRITTHTSTVTYELSRRYSDPVVLTAQEFVRLVEFVAALPPPRDNPTQLVTDPKPGFFARLFKVKP